MLPLIESMLLTRGDRAESYLAAGMAYSKTGQRKQQKSEAEAKQWFAKARDVYSQAIAKWPADRQFVGRYADMCMVLREEGSGEKVLKAYADRPENKGKADPLVMLAEFYSRTQSPSHAQMFLQQAMEVEPNNVEVRSRLVAQLAALRQYDQALLILDQAKNAEPLLIRQKIEILISAGRLADARTLLNDLLTVHPNDPNYMSALFFVAMKENKTEEARPTIAKVLAIDPHHAMALYYRGIIHVRQTPPDYVGALTDLRTALVYAPDNPDIRKAVQEAEAAAKGRPKGR